MTWKEFEELITVTEANGGDVAVMKNFYSHNKPGATSYRIKESDIRWTPACQTFLEELEAVAAEQNLAFNPRFDLREWVVSRVDWNKTCAKDRITPCPCPDPVARGCPLFYKK